MGRTIKQFVLLQTLAYEQKVTLITVHAAKGLEWPVVFIPAVEQGTYPSYRCTEPHEIAEERRLLYVAMTRAQGFLVGSVNTYCLTADVVSLSLSNDGR